MQKNISEKIPLNIYKDLTEVIAKGCESTFKVLQENKRLGIPTPFSLQGRIYYLMPDGRIVLKRAKRQR